MDELWKNIDPVVIGTRIASYVPNLVGAMVLALVFVIIAVLVRKALSAALQKGKVPDGAGQLVLRFAKYFIVAIALLSIADQLGINVTALIAGLGVAGLALSFAAQDTVQNIISGVALIIDRPFRVGDWISIGDQHASVADIRLRTTVLTSFDNETIVVPNKMLVQERIINYTLTPRIRIRVPVGIAYKEDIDAARKVMLATVEGDDRILADPAPIVLLTSLGASSVNLEMRFWCEDSIQKFTLMWEYTEKCKKALDAAGIQIPYPHLQLFLERTEGLKELAGNQG